MSKENNNDLGNDVMELAKVWNNLSDDMKFLLAKAIGGEEFVEGTSKLISEIGNFDSGFYADIVKNTSNYIEYVKEGISAVKELDDSLVNLKTVTDR